MTNHVFVVYGTLPKFIKCGKFKGSESGSIMIVDSRLKFYWNNRKLFMSKIDKREVCDVSDIKSVGDVERSRVKEKDKGGVERDTSKVGCRQKW